MEHTEKIANFHAKGQESIVKISSKLMKIKRMETCSIKKQNSCFKLFRLNFYGFQLKLPCFHDSRTMNAIWTESLSKNIIIAGNKRTLSPHNNYLKELFIHCHRRLIDIRKQKQYIGQPLRIGEMYIRKKAIWIHCTWASASWINLAYSARPLAVYFALDSPKDVNSFLFMRIAFRLAT